MDAGRGGRVSGGGFTRELWASIAPVYGRILEHPFVRGLTDGSLDEAAFRFYVVQDALYLREFARALALLGARGPSEDEILLFARHAAETIEVERALHAGFLHELGLDERELEATPMAPACRAYSSFLLASVYGGSFVEGLAAVLPCYWIYWEVGKALAERGSPHPLYRRWIETYAGEQFAVAVRAALAAMERAAERAGEEERRRARELFAAAARYEWLFWDMGHRQEAWPV